MAAAAAAAEMGAPEIGGGGPGIGERLLAAENTARASTSCCSFARLSCCFFASLCRL